MKLCECGCGQAAPIATFTSRAQGYTKGQPRRFVYGHQYEYVAKVATETWQRRLGPEYAVDANGCWLWQRGLNQDGYGRKMISGVRHFAHRLYYERRYGPIPAGWHDHKCGVTACVNPDHLEALSPRHHGGTRATSPTVADAVRASDESNHALSRRPEPGSAALAAIRIVRGGSAKGA